MEWLYFVLIGVLLLLLLVALAVAVHAGFFTDIIIRTSRDPNCIRRVAYKSYRGPYKQANEAFRAICGLAPQCTPFGIYYDSPSKVSAEKCRYVVGCCLPEPPVDSLEGRIVARGYTVHTFPECKEAVVTEFPFRSQFSLLVAPYRVYYALEKYIERSKRPLPQGPFIEVYKSDFIKYFSPIDNSQDFIVPEVRVQCSQETDHDSQDQDPNIKKNQ